MAIIMFNGKTYNSVEEMPDNERRAYEQIAEMLVDKNGNGIPDFLEGDLVRNVLTAFTGSVNFNGQTYNGANELPPELSEKIRGAVEKLSEMGIVAKVPPMTAQIEQPIAASRPLVLPKSNPTIQEEGNSPLMWVMIGAVLMLCLAAVGIGIFFLLR